MKANNYPYKLFIVVFNLAWVFLALLILSASDAGHAAAAPSGTSYRVCPAGPPACDFATIQAAVDAATDGDEIKIAAGTYTGVTQRPAPADYDGPPMINQVVYLTKSITLRGGYTTSNWNVSDPEAQPTILDAQGQGRALLIAGDITPLIAGLRFTGGNAANLGGTLWTDAGGGIYILKAAATISGCQVYANIAGTTFGGTGGGLFLASSSATVNNSTIRSNIAGTLGEGYGGGLALDNSPAAITHNAIYDNVGSAGDWGYGGGIDLFASAATVSDNDIYDNKASTASQGFGGALHVQQSTAEISSNTIHSNTASTVDSGYGGGIQLSESGGLLQGNTFTSNTATAVTTGIGYGGGLDLLQSSATLSRNVIQDNNAGSGQWGFGGGLSLTDSEGEMVNNAIVDNQAGVFGSGLFISGQSPTMIHTTIARNLGGDATGLYLDDHAAVTLTNTILAGQVTAVHAEAGSSALLNGVLWHSNTSNSSGAVTVNNETSGDPLFAADGYHILAGSAAINAGIEAGITEDIDSEPRPNQVSDLGADEFWPGSKFNLFLPLILSN